jgi:histidinol-phosphatase (PHP family)
MIDYHVHTEHSIDAQGSLVAYCDQALRMGLTEICFTNHCELDPERNDNLIRWNGSMVPITRDRVAALYDAIHGIAETYRGKGLLVKSGIEIGYFDGVQPRLNEIIHGVDLDFVLGSIHCLNHVCIDSSKEYIEYFEHRRAQALLEEYYNAVEGLVKSRLFDSLGHLDVYKKYGYGFYGETIGEFPAEQVRHVFELTAKYDIALEINTAGLRRVNEIYPAAPIMECARNAGIKKLTIGSDAHCPGDLGRGLKDGYAYARSFGYDAVYGFTKRKAYRVPI